MKMNKERFLKTEFGSEMISIVKALDYYIEEKSHTSEWNDPQKTKALQNEINILFAQWNICKLAVKQFFGLDYSFTRTDEYFGACTEDEAEWLIKIDRRREP